MQDRTQKSARCCARAPAGRAPNRAMRSVYFQRKCRRIEGAVAALILIGALGCGSENSRAEQARALLERIAAVNPDAPRAQRARQLEQLRAVPLQDPELARVRDACALAHAGLLEAEGEQEAVRVRLDRAGDGGLPPLEVLAMQAALAQAGEKLRAAHGMLPECEGQTRVLTERYR